MPQDRSNANEAHESAQVLRFRPRDRLDEMHRPAGATEAADYEIDSFHDLPHHEQDGPDEENIDYRQRMLMNVIAVIVTGFLIGAGVWIADTIATMQRNQDCIMQGRKNCAPIEVTAPVPRPPN
jgi:hypothetical protein